MASSLIMDLVEDLSMTERDGAVVEMRRRGIVKDLDNTNTDPRTLQEALDAANVPAAGSSPTGFDNLVLVERNPTMLNGPTIAEIEFLYISKAEAGLGFVFEGGSSLTQITSVNDRNGAQITVEHNGVIQGGEVNVLTPQTTLRATGVLVTDFPWFTSIQWIGRLNETRWAGNPPLTWMCTAVDYVSVDQGTSPSSWKFTFEFQADLLGQQPEVVFTDASTGKPPAGLIPGVGFKSVDWYPTRNFNTRFPIIA